MRQVSVLSVCAALLVAAGGPGGEPPAPACDADDGGITLPSGFCATVFADSIRGARHLVVAPNGDVFVSVQGPNGGVVALRDADHDGRAEVREKFASGFASSEVALFDGFLYTEAAPPPVQGQRQASSTRAIVRYPLKAGELTAAGPPDTIVADLPGQPGHSTRNFAISRDGAMYVNVGSHGNACQPSGKDRAPGVPGDDPCTALETRAGIWRFDARKHHQTQSTGVHFARGIRNAVGIAIDPADGRLWVMQHGRDQLADWRQHLGMDSAAAVKFNAEVPAEELFQVNNGDDFGWPYCYFDPLQKKKVLAPEYGGDGKKVGRCAQKKGDVAYFPGHWAPNGLLFYTGTALPAKYRSGAFIAFHGSWNRAPLPQAGFNVVFQPLRAGKAAGAYEVFADGFAKNLNAPHNPPAVGNHRPTGLAQAPDGALYVADDALGRIWKIVYTGGKAHQR